MFTGIVEERGTVRSAGRRLEVECELVATDSPVGASVAVNGVCLTVVGRDPGCLSFDLSDETLARTALGRLAPGAAVNLERPVTLASRLGGHVVQGHVDGVGEVVAMGDDGAAGARMRVRLPPAVARYTIEKGSITVDGVSLTVAELHDDGVTIALIPHTLASTTLGSAGAGRVVNLEADMIAKYVERLLPASAGDATNEVTMTDATTLGGHRR